MADLSGKLAKSTRTSAPKQKVSETFTTATEAPTRTTVYLPAGLAKRLKHAAIEEERSVSSILAELAEGWLGKGRN
ncbi:ribbon-helix-helix domain-containing protein [Corynebacterium alimapuense]|uniref:CopG family transcriptional regulator n=1 Tax=Corynebacterium alimapuense TaxID=1576874 RepID=A0A3M8K6D0_9CORY|nr:ribbon-helix-helix protein, CopG family [Corynebacterium alimapuense]RNE48054.1 CopG family transcriptional regulator [Corynebacterium alimapuense]